MTCVQSDNFVLYKGFAWKHHLAEDFENGTCPTHPNGAGKGSTIFTDYDKMLRYLKRDGRRWYVAELVLDFEVIQYGFGNSYMATILSNKSSKEGFKPLTV